MDRTRVVKTLFWIHSSSGTFPDFLPFLVIANWKPQKETAFEPCDKDAMTLKYFEHVICLLCNVFSKHAIEPTFYYYLGSYFRGYNQQILHLDLAHILGSWNPDLPLKWTTVTFDGGKSRLKWWKIDQVYVTDNRAKKYLIVASKYNFLL